MWWLLYKLKLRNVDSMAPPRSLREMWVIINDIKAGSRVDALGPQGTDSVYCKETLGGIKPIFLGPVVDYKVRCYVIAPRTWRF
jgi:hypothetical protein